MELINGPSLAQLVERDRAAPARPGAPAAPRGALGAGPRARLRASSIATSSRRTCCIAPDGSLQITDFGLALALRGKFGGATSQSGTPQFASPEQLLGERVDQRSDLYSLAAVAYYALLGRSPFPGAHAGAGAGQADH